MIHLQGMGVIGSLLAHTLREQRIKFTWSDTEEEHTAWQACTGAVYPTGESQELENYLRWQHDINHDALPPEITEHMEQAAWCYNGINPPHHGELAGVHSLTRGNAAVDPLVISDGISYQFDMQSIVKATRTKFAKRRTDGYSGSGDLIVTHGSAQADKFVWGWSINCKLDFSAEFLETLDELGIGMRPTLYMRQVYDMSYLYPHPRRQDLWYGGTATITQSVPKSLDVQAHYRRFKDKVAERSGGHVTVAGGVKGTLVEGWRPKYSGGTVMPLAKRVAGRQIMLRPMGGNGVRFFPLLADAVLEQL